MKSSPNRQRAIITGASSGIGKSTALAFGKAGIDVALISRTKEKLTPLADKIASWGVQVKVYPLDLSNISTIKTNLEAIVSDFGTIDILVNNAGMGYTNLLEDTSLTDWQKVIDLNLTSVFECIKAVLPTMKSQGRGTIINVASIAATNSFPAWGAYGVSKAALISLGQYLAVEERTNGIRVTNISPGAVNTPIWDSETINADLNREAMLHPDTVAEVILQTVMLPDSAVIESLTITPSKGIL